MTSFLFVYVTLLLSFLFDGSATTVCVSKEAFQCENLLHHELEHYTELDAHRFCSYLASLQSCLLHTAHCSPENTTKVIDSAKEGIGVTCTSLKDSKTELANGCKDPAYTVCLHEDKMNAAEANKKAKLAKDYVCDLTHKTNECLQKKAYCNKNFRQYRVKLAEHRFGLTCSSAPTNISTLLVTLAVFLSSFCIHSFMSR